MAVVLHGVLNDGVGRGCLPGCRRSGYVDASAGRIVMYALSCLKMPPYTYLYIYMRVLSRCVWVGDAGSVLCVLQLCVRCGWVLWLLGWKFAVVIRVNGLVLLLGALWWRGCCRVLMVCRSFFERVSKMALGCIVCGSLWWLFLTDSIWMWNLSKIFRWAPFLL